VHRELSKQYLSFFRKNDAGSQRVYYSCCHAAATTRICVCPSKWKGFCLLFWRFFYVNLFAFLHCSNLLWLYRQVSIKVPILFPKSSILDILNPWTVQFHACIAHLNIYTSIIICLCAQWCAPNIYYIS